LERIRFKLECESDQRIRQPIRALESPGLTHRFALTAGVRDVEDRCLIQEFFREKRRLL